MTNAAAAVEAILKMAAERFRAATPTWQNDPSATPVGFIDTLSAAYTHWAPNAKDRAALLPSLKGQGHLPPPSFEISHQDTLSWDQFEASLVEHLLLDELRRRNPGLDRINNTI